MVRAAISIYLTFGIWYSRKAKASSGCQDQVGFITSEAFFIEKATEHGAGLEFKRLSNLDIWFVGSGYGLGAAFLRDNPPGRSYEDDSRRTEQNGWFVHDTSIHVIMPEAACESMWQWKSHLPGLSATNAISRVSPPNIKTVSRKGPTEPSFSNSRKCMP